MLPNVNLASWLLRLRPGAPAANEPANAGANGSHARRSPTFDGWLFVLMLAFVALAVGSSLYVSFTSLRYVAEVIGGMPANVATAFPLTIDATVAGALLGEWWLAGRRAKHRWPFSYMVAFGVVFAVLTILGNAAHGALTLSVQRPIELLVGGQLVPMPWWVSIAVSAVPGLAIGASGYAMALVVAVWRGERVSGANGSQVDSHPGSQPGSHETDDPDPDDSQPSPPERPANRSQPDPQVIRIARAGGDWHAVAKATGLGEHAAKRALTAARKRIRPVGVRTRRAA